MFILLTKGSSRLSSYFTPTFFFLFLGFEILLLDEMVFRFLILLEHLLEELGVFSDMSSSGVQEGCLLHLLPHKGGHQGLLRFLLFHLERKIILLI